MIQGGISMDDAVYPSDGKLLSSFRLKPPTLSNNKNYRLKKVVFFLCNKRELAVKPTIYQNSAVSEAFLGKF